VICVLGVDRAYRATLMGWCVASANGCAAISGLDQIQEVQCAPSCRGSPSGPVDASAGRDASVGDPATDPPKVAYDATTVADSAADSAHTYVVDSATDDDATDVVASSADAGRYPANDSGCDALGSVNNCGACGVKCPVAGGAASIQSAMCRGRDAGGSTCSYTCAAGFLDCNASNFPNVDGCECQAPGATSASCCSTECPSPHNDGLGLITSVFYGCSPAGVIDLRLATDACINFAGNSSMCVAGPCVNAGADAGNGDEVVCARTANDCPCWTYRGPNSGFVHDSRVAGQCRCHNGQAGNDPRFL
jgi:hypothetical protein